MFGEVLSTNFVDEIDTFLCSNVFHDFCASSLFPSSFEQIGTITIKTDIISTELRFIVLKRTIVIHIPSLHRFGEFGVTLFDSRRVDVPPSRRGPRRWPHHVNV